jgi:hypothetical protein
MIIDLVKGEPIAASFPLIKDQVIGVAFTPDGSTLIAAGRVGLTMLLIDVVGL